jgi:hypothetical protein
VSCVSAKLRLSVQDFAITAERLHLDNQAAAVEAVIAQSLGGAHQQLPHKRRCACDASVFRRQHVLVADTRALRFRAGDVRAMEKFVHLGPGDAAPDHAQAGGIGIPERGHVSDAGAPQAFRHAGADARNSPYLQVQDGAG